MEDGKLWGGHTWRIVSSTYQSMIPLPYRSHNKKKIKNMKKKGILSFKFGETKKIWTRLGRDLQDLKYSLESSIAKSKGVAVVSANMHLYLSHHGWRMVMTLPSKLQLRQPHDRSIEVSNLHFQVEWLKLDEVIWNNFETYDLTHKNLHFTNSTT